MRCEQRDQVSDPNAEAPWESSSCTASVDVETIMYDLFQCSSDGTWQAVVGASCTQITYDPSHTYTVGNEVCNDDYPEDASCG